MSEPRRCNVKWNVKFEGDFLKICKGEDDKALGCSYEYFLALDKVDALKAENERLVQAIKDAWFVLQGSIAIEGQSDELLDRREQAIDRFLETLGTLEARKDNAPS